MRWLALGATILVPTEAWAHDCSSLQDCLQTGGFNAVVGVFGGLIAVITWLVGHSAQPPVAPPRGEKEEPDPAPLDHGPTEPIVAEPLVGPAAAPLDHGPTEPFAPDPPSPTPEDEQPLYDNHGNLAPRDGDLYAWYDEWITREAFERRKAEEYEALERRAQDRYRDHDRFREENWEALKNQARQDAIDAQGIDIQPIDHVAVRVERPHEVANREAWVDAMRDGQAGFGDYSDVYQPLVATVDEFNRQRVRQEVLDELREQALDDYREVDEALDRTSRNDDNQHVIEHLERQHARARDNLQRIGQATTNSARIMAQSGDRIVGRGMGGTMEIGVRSGGDVMAGADLVDGAGRMGKWAAEHGPPRWGRGHDGMGKVSGDGVSTVGSRPSPGSTRSSRRPRATREALDDNLPTLRLNPHETLPRRNRRVYGGIRVIEDTKLTSLGGVSRAQPGEMRINPARIRNASRTVEAPNDDHFEELVIYHERTHLEHGYHYEPAMRKDVDPHGRLSGRKQWLYRRRQRIHDQIRTEEAVTQQMRRDFADGKMPDHITQADLDAYERHQRQVLDRMRQERDEIRAEIMTPDRRR